jgi:hypothetical protein
VILDWGRGKRGRGQRVILSKVILRDARHYASYVMERVFLGVSILESFSRAKMPT